MRNDPQALRSAASALIQAAEMLEHNDRIFTGKWRKGSKAWGGDFIERKIQEAIASLNGTPALKWRSCTEKPATEEIFSALLAFHDQDGDEPETILYGIYLWRGGKFVNEDHGAEPKAQFWWIPEIEITATCPATVKS